jgi:ParB family chromosome partitioning protein
MDLIKRYSLSMDMLELIELQFLVTPTIQVRTELGNLDELMRSIRENGLLQPIIVRPRDSRFEIVAGNRRYQACKKLRWRLMPCIVKELSDKEAYELSLLENVQRDNLSIIEEAQAYRNYTEKFGWGGVSELARKIGKSEAHISHCISILNLPIEILAKIRAGELKKSVALELLWIHDKDLRAKIVELNSERKLTVRQVRSLAKKAKSLESNESLSQSLSSRSHSKEYSILEKAILCLRISLLRLDSLIERTTDQNLRHYLMEKRFALHALIDDVIKRKMMMREY